MINDDIITALAKKYNTPLYLYDGNIISEKINRMKKLLPPDTVLFYSIKANPLIGITRLMREKGCKVEVASDGEIEIALCAGFNGADIIFTGPGKTEEEILFAIEKGVYCIIAESYEEILCINSLSKKLNRVTNIGLRLNPSIDNISGSVIMGGVSQFGISEEFVDNIIPKVKSLSNIRLIALHSYLASQQLDAGKIVDNVRHIFNLYNELIEKHSLDIELLDFGGGFGVPYFPHEHALDEDRLRNGLAEVFTNKKEGIVLAFESGRYLLADAGVYITKIIYVKECKDKLFAIVDGGSHHYSSLAFLGRYIRHNFPARIISEKKQIKTATVTVCGKQCAPTDILAKDIELNMPNAGDLMIFEKSGAYGFSMSPVLFLSNKTCTELLLLEDRVYLLRESMGREFFANIQKSNENYIRIQDL
ncbi:MAG: hypothetical protein ACM3TR_10140 [Caulobacteraceae bacterium]